MGITILKHQIYNKRHLRLFALIVMVTCSISAYSKMADEIKLDQRYYWGEGTSDKHKDAKDIASSYSIEDNVPTSVKKSAKQLTKEGWKVIGDDSLAEQLWNIQKLKATKSLDGDLLYLISEGEAQDYDYENAVDAARLNAIATLAGLVESQINSVSSINNGTFSSKVQEKTSIDANKVKTIMTMYKKTDSMYWVRVFVIVNV